MSKNNTPTIKEIEYCLSPKAEPKKVFDILRRLKESPNLPDDVAGAKLFLEKNNYDLNKLRLFLEKSKIKALNKNLSEKNNINKHQKFVKLNPFYRAAVAAFILIIGGYSIFKLTNSNQNKKFSEFEIEEFGLPVFMSENYDNKFDEFMSTFKKDEFKIAAKIGESLNKNDSVFYFLGFSYYKSSDYDLAIQNLNLVSETSKFKQRSIYVLALINWKQKNLMLAEELFYKLKNNSEFGLLASKALDHKDFKKK